MNEYDPWLAYQRIRKNNTAIIDYVCSQYGITGKGKAAYDPENIRCPAKGL
jgi:hypothetical protein